MRSAINEIPTSCSFSGVSRSSLWSSSLMVRAKRLLRPRRVEHGGLREELAQPLRHLGGAVEQLGELLPSLRVQLDDQLRFHVLNGTHAAAESALLGRALSVSPDQRARDRGAAALAAVHQRVRGSPVSPRSRLMRRGGRLSGSSPIMREVEEEEEEALELHVAIQSEDGSYWAQIQEMPGCFATGDTLDELFDGLKEAVESCLDDCSMSGRRLSVASAVLETVSK